MKLKDIKKPKEKILLTVGYITILLLFYFLKLPCVVLTATGFPCVLCGMTRAYLSLFSLDIGGAFSYHPMFWALPLLYLYFIFDGKIFKGEKLNKIILFAILGGFLANFIANIVKTALFL